MELKKYQKQVISDLIRFCELVNEKSDVVKAYNTFWEEKNVYVGFGGLLPYSNTVFNTPHICFKVPTGGGKTFLACSSLRPIFESMPANKQKAVLWLVPSDAILTQTIDNLTNVDHPYRQKIEADFNGRVQVYTKEELLFGQQFNPTTVSEQLSVFIMSMDSFRISRQKRGDRKVYQENSNLYQFVKFFINKDTLLEGVDETALIQIINQLEPVVIVDESHHTIGDLSVQMLNDLNPSFILDLTATPRNNSNIISFVDAMQLKRENMVKLPVILYNRHSKEEVIADAIDLRNKLELQAIEEEKTSKRYIRPIVLFQAEPKTSESKETFDKLKGKLKSVGIPEEQIAIKTASINELKNVNLLSKECQIRYIITINALKEGWDCSFAYILATIADKSSVVDVEQILGRVLRQPYTKQNANKFLNISYVLTCSNVFNDTIKNVIKGLNNAGFSSKDFRIGFDTFKPTAQPDTAQVTKEEVVTPQEEFMDIDETKIVTSIENNNTHPQTSTIEEIFNVANINCDDYLSQINNLSDDIIVAPAEVRENMRINEMYEQFQEEALGLIIPQYFVKAAPSLFGNDEMILLTKAFLSENFTLNNKDAIIDFSFADETVVEIDVSGKDTTPKYRNLRSEESTYFKKYFESFPAEIRKNECKKRIKNDLGKFDFIDAKDLTAYIDRIVDGMNKEILEGLENNVVSYTQKIKKKILQLLDEHCEKQFDSWIEQGKIICKGNYKLKKEINPINTYDLLGKSLYIKEEAINGFELSIIEKIASLPNIKWWHRNMKNSGFSINTFFNHYPDFTIMTISGKIIMVETKGKVFVTTEESRIRAKFGKKWQDKAGDNYRYFMVYENNDTIIVPNATKFDDFMNIIKVL